MSQNALPSGAKPRAGTIKHALQAHKWLYIMIIPGVIYMLVFSYLPMGGLIMAFQEFLFFRSADLPPGGYMMESWFRQNWICFLL